jgi:hypothetical protein
MKTSSKSVYDLQKKELRSRLEAKVDDAKVRSRAML